MVWYTIFAELANGGSRALPADAGDAEAQANSCRPSQVSAFALYLHARVVVCLLSDLFLSPAQPRFCRT
jgi:hypothetical protein